MEVTGPILPLMGRTLKILIELIMVREYFFIIILMYKYRKLLITYQGGFLFLTR